MYVLTVYILLVNKLIYKDQAYSNAQLSTQINASPTQARLEPPYIRHKSIQTNTSATRINTSLKGLNTSHFYACSLGSGSGSKENQKQIPQISKQTRGFLESFFFLGVKTIRVKTILHQNILTILSPFCIGMYPKR